MAGWSLIRIRCNYFWCCSIGIPIVYFIGSHIFTEKMLFWREKFKPHQFHYIAIEVKIGPPMAGPGCMLWAPFLVWYLRVPIGTTKRVGSLI